MTREQARQLAAEIVLDNYCRRNFAYDPVQCAEFEQAVADAILRAETAARTEQREACARHLDAEAAMWIGDESVYSAAIWQALTSAGAALRTMSD